MTAPRTRRKATAAVEPLPQHLNFSFRDWLRQRTELPRKGRGWTPLSALYADYRIWCHANAIPAEYLHSEPEISGKLRAHCDRAPETRLVEHRGLNQTVISSGYELCFPRYLMPPIRVAA